MRTAARDLVDLPELNIALFSFLLHFVWEMWQVPFFAGMPSTAHWSGVAGCSRATLGDAAMAVVAFWAAALPRRSRYWFAAPRGWEGLIYLATGLTLTPTLALRRLCSPIAVDAEPNCAHNSLIFMLTVVGWER